MGLMDIHACVLVTLQESFADIEDYPIQFVGMKTEISPVTITATVLTLEASWPVCACQDLLENGVKRTLMSAALIHA